MQVSCTSERIARADYHPRELSDLTPAGAVGHAFTKLLGGDPKTLMDTRKEVEALGGRAVAISTDAGHADEVEAAAGQIEAAFGPIDIWINNAMVTVFSLINGCWPSKGTGSGWRLSRRP